MSIRRWKFASFGIMYLAGGRLVTSLAAHQSASSDHQRRQSAFDNSVDVGETDIRVIVRQTGQSAPSKAVIGVPKDCGCRHGFPQVFALDPLPKSSGKRMNSGLLKLTCPLLVRAVDQLEDEGMIQTFNQRLAEDQALQRSMLEAHGIHARARNQLLADESDINVVQQKLGERGAAAFLGAGVAGASADASGDVKCLHAWLGDYLFRGESASPIGSMVAEELVRRGIEVNGNPTCQWLCDPSSSRAAAPPTPRNKQRLKSGKELARRRRKKDGDEAD